ncbi:MAG TPA: hypothetical protein ENJ06_05050 [Phycisphaeraceae bacterium]|nr:hypothetical protein [Phycisphaeraceae bacterium]
MKFTDMVKDRRSFLKLLLGVSAAPLLTACASQRSPMTKRHNQRIHPLPDDEFEMPAALRDWKPLEEPDFLTIVGARPRSEWAGAAPIVSRMNPMGRVEHITVHHEGMAPVYFDSTRDVASQLDLVRRSHLNRMQAGDIGYHFIIDRAGRLWQGRPLAFQGAHVKYHNRHNLGVMVMGNFDKQSPTQAQRDALVTFLRKSQSAFNVPVRLVHTHQELAPTACPGVTLQGFMKDIRGNGTLT